MMLAATPDIQVTWSPRGLGVLLYHLVTNDFPVTAKTLEELRDAHADGTRKRLRDVRPDLPTSSTTRG